MKLKDFYPNLTENKAQEAASAIDKALMGVDESLSYKDFALAVARVLMDAYGQHNFMPFMDILHAELGISESLNENFDNTLGEEFEAEFGMRAYADSGRIEIFYRDDIDKDLFEKMIQWVESKGHKVDRDQSTEWYGEDDDRYWYPRIKFDN